MDQDIKEKITQIGPYDIINGKIITKTTKIVAGIALGFITICGILYIRWRRQSKKDDKNDKDKKDDKESSNQNNAEFYTKYIVSYSTQPQQEQNQDYESKYMIKSNSRIRSFDELFDQNKSKQHQQEQKETVILSEEIDEQKVKQIQSESQKIQKIIQQQQSQSQISFNQSNIKEKQSQIQKNQIKQKSQVQHSQQEKQSEKLLQIVRELKLAQQSYDQISVNSSLNTNTFRQRLYQYRCPLSKKIMIKPVNLSCTHQFQQKQILKHLKDKKYCPICQMKANETDVRFCKGLKIQIDRFIKRYQAKSQKWILEKSLGFEETREAFLANLNIKINSSQKQQEENCKSSIK